MSLCWTSVSAWQPLGGRMQHLSMCQRQSGVHQGKCLKDKCFSFFSFYLYEWMNEWMCSWPSFSGGLWPAALPVARDARARASLLSRRSWMPGAQLPDVPLSPLPPVGFLLKPWSHPNPPNQMWAQLSLSGQELCSHHPYIQQGQTTHSKYSRSKLVFCFLTQKPYDGTVAEGWFQMVVPWHCLWDLIKTSENLVIILG